MRNRLRKRCMAFQCYTEHTWHIYAVKEVTSELQNAMENKLIQSIKFKDVRYICSWSRCAPAAVEITKIGV